MTAFKRTIPTPSNASLTPILYTSVPGGRVGGTQAENTARFLASRIPLEIQDILLRDTCAVISMRLTRTFAGRRPAVGESSRVLDIRGAQLAPSLASRESTMGWLFLNNKKFDEKRKF